MAANGFVNRWLGKVLAKQLWIGAGGLVVAGSTNVTVTPTQLANIANNAAVTSYTSAVAANVPNSGIAGVSASSGAFVLTLDTPAANSSKLFGFTSVSSGVFIKSTAATFDGTNVVFKTTIAGNVRLRGLSTARWLVEGVFPSTVSLLTFSATT